MDPHCLVDKSGVCQPASSQLRFIPDWGVCWMCWAYKWYCNSQSHFTKIKYWLKKAMSIFESLQNRVLCKPWNLVKLHIVMFGCGLVTQFYPYLSGSHTIAPEPVKLPQRLWANIPHQFAGKSNSQTVSISTRNQCTYFLGHTLYFVSVFKPYCKYLNPTCSFCSVASPANFPADCCILHIEEGILTRASICTIKS